MAATVKDIAKHSGLGLATISKYLNGGNVLENNKIKIEKAISELDFTVNEFARGLKTRKSKIIGVIIPELSNVFITSIITVIEDLLRKNGYAVLVCDCRTDKDLEKKSMQFLLNKRVDGIVNMPASGSGEHIRMALEKGIPVILIDRIINDIMDKVDVVIIDNKNATYNGVIHLIQNGHKNIGVIVGPKDIFTSEERLGGYREALENNSIDEEEDLIYHGDYTVQGGYEGAKKLFETNKKMTAIIVTNYEMTLGTIIAINELGIKIPDELSLIGFDNLQLSQVVNPKLTIISQPLNEIGENVARLMLERLSQDNAGSAPKKIILSTTIQEGKSVKHL